MNNNNQKAACIIGGGMSGLFTGALLAKNEYKVTILEKNHIAGGGLQSFRRGNAVFNTGMQAFVGYKEGLIVKSLIDYLGLYVDILPTDEHAQEIVFTDTEHCYFLPRGRDAYEDYLQKQFPAERQGIKELLDAFYRIAFAVDYLWLKNMQLHPETIEFMDKTAEQVIRKYIKDENLIKMFGYVGIHAGSNIKYTPVLEFGMLMVAYIEKACRFVGGGIVFANTLVDYIKRCGGEVLNNSEVLKIELTNNDEVKCVRTQKNTYYSDVYVSSIVPSELLKIGGGATLRKSTSERVKDYTNKFSGFAIYIDLKKNSFPFINSGVFIYKDFQNKNLPNYIYILTPPAEHNPQWATTMEILVPADYSDFEKWENTWVENRGIKYEEMKNKYANEIINYVSNYYPQLKNSINKIYTATGLTVRDYYNNPQGAIYGQQGLFVPIKTKTKNLFLTGQAVQYQGLCGVSVASLLTTETILGRSLIDEIAKVK